MKTQRSFRIEDSIFEQLEELVEHYQKEYIGIKVSPAVVVQLLINEKYKEVK